MLSFNRFITDVRFRISISTTIRIVFTHFSIMKNLYTAKGFLLFLFIGLCIQLQAGPPSPFYQGDLDKLKKQARKTDTPYFIYFQLSNCESCDEMNQKTWRDPRLSRYVSQHYLGHEVKVMTPAQGKKILDDYGIFVYPALLVFNANGKLEKHVEGYVDSQAALAIFSGKPICTPLVQAVGDKKTATTSQKGKSLTTRPVQNGKSIAASHSVNIPKKEAAPLVRQISPKRVVATPIEAANRKQDPQTSTPNNVRNLTYLRYQHLQRQAEHTKQRTPPATAKTVVTTRPYTAKVPTKATARNTNPYSVERTAPVLTPTTRGENPYSSQSNTKKQVVTTRTLPAYPAQSVRTNMRQATQSHVSFQEVADPRFRAYNPWKSLAPIAGINYSLILDGYTTSDQVLQQIETIKRYWPNSIWVYQEGEAGVYRVALGNFRSEDQAQQYAELLLRSQQLNAGIQDLFEVISPSVPNSVKGP